MTEMPRPVNSEQHYMAGIYRRLGELIDLQKAALQPPEQDEPGAAEVELREPDRGGLLAAPPAATEEPDPEPEPAEVPRKRASPKKATKAATRTTAKETS